MTTHTGTTMMHIEERKAIETRESQLWWLAVLIIVLMTLALYAMDSSNMTETWWVSDPLKIALNTRLMRGALILSALLICAYFRDSSRHLRRENGRLINDLASYSKELEKKNYELSRLKDLSDQLISLVDLKKAFGLVLDTAVDVIGADVASILIRDKENGVLKIVASHGLPPEVPKSTRLKMGEAIAGLVAQEGKPLILNSDQLPPELANRALRVDSILSSVIVPIQVADETRGVICIANSNGSTRYEQEDLDALCTVANQASLAIQKVDLLDNLKNQVEMLAAAIKQLRQTQAELLQSEKLASIGQLAGGVAHEINNPVQVVMGRTELLLAQETDEKKINNLTNILEHTVRIGDIVSNLLSFSRVNKDPDFHEMDVNDIVSKALSLLEPQLAPENIVLVRSLQSDMQPIVGNASQLQQVFTNILLNAFQAMKGQEGGKFIVSSRSKGDMIELEFADTGPGIEEEHLARIFEPFFTTKPEGEGTGLGLSIVYGIIQSHGGTIRAESKPGQGASFTITLPVKTA